MSPPSTHDPLAEGLGWRELDAAPVDDDRWPFRPPLVTRRTDEVPSLAPDVWDTAVAKAQAVYRRTGIRSGTPEAPQWTAGRGRRKVHIEAEPTGLGGRITVEYIRPEPRPWLMAVSLLCVPTALVGATVLLARPAGLMDWAVVGGLLALPAAVGAGIAAMEWMETLAARWRARRVVRAVRKAGRRAETVWVSAPQVEDLQPVDEADVLEVETHEPTLLPEHVAPAEWLSSDELVDLDGATPAEPEPETALVWPVEAPAGTPAPSAPQRAEPLADRPPVERHAPPPLERDPAPPEPVSVSREPTSPEPARVARPAPSPEVAAEPAPVARAESAFRDVPFSVTHPASAPVFRPHGDGVRASSEQLPELEVIHLSDLAPAPQPAGGDGLAGPPPELGLGRRPPEPAAVRPPEPRAARVVPTRPVSFPTGPTDVFKEWHPPPPWAWE